MGIWGGVGFFTAHEALDSVCLGKLDFGVGGFVEVVKRLAEKKSLLLVIIRKKQKGGKGMMGGLLRLKNCRIQYAMYNGSIELLSYRNRHP